MELLEGKELRKRILNSYSKEPRGWSFVISPSDSGFYDALVSGQDDAWMLKIDSLFKPAPMVIGSPVEASPKKQGPFPYGYRTLPTDLALQLMEGGGPGGSSAERRLVSVLRSEPVVPEAGRSYAEGPLVLTSPRMVSLSESQREINARLASEMRRLLRLRYPAYG